MPCDIVVVFLNSHFHSFPCHSFSFCHTKDYRAEDVWVSYMVWHYSGLNSSSSSSSLMG